MPQVNFTRPTEFGYGQVWITGSKSRPGVYHTTLREDNGTWKCSCEGQRYNKSCRHVNELQEQYGDVDTDDVQVNL